MFRCRVTYKWLQGSRASNSNMKSVLRQSTLQNCYAFIFSDFRSHRSSCIRAWNEMTRAKVESIIKGFKL